MQNENSINEERTLQTSYSDQRDVLSNQFVDFIPCNNDNNTQTQIQYSSWYMIVLTSTKISAFLESSGGDIVPLSLRNRPPYIYYWHHSRNTEIAQNYMLVRNTQIISYIIQNNIYIN